MNIPTIINTMMGVVDGFVNGLKATPYALAHNDAYPFMLRSAIINGITRGISSSVSSNELAHRIADFSAGYIVATRELTSFVKNSAPVVSLTEKQKLGIGAYYAIPLGSIYSYASSFFTSSQVNNNPPFCPSAQQVLLETCPHLPPRFNQCFSMMCPDPIEMFKVQRALFSPLPKIDDPFLRSCPNPYSFDLKKPQNSFISSLCHENYFSEICEDPKFRIHVEKSSSLSPSWNQILVAANVAIGTSYLSMRLFQHTYRLYHKRGSKGRSEPIKTIASGILGTAVFLGGSLTSLFILQR